MIANREFSSDPLFVLSVATGFVYKAWGSYQIKTRNQERSAHSPVLASVLVPLSSPLVVISVSALVVTRVVLLVFEPPVPVSFPYPVPLLVPPTSAPLARTSARAYYHLLPLLLLTS